MLPSGLADIRCQPSLNDCVEQSHLVAWNSEVYKRSKLQCDLGFISLFICLFLFLKVGMDLSLVIAAYLFNLNNKNH